MVAAGSKAAAGLDAKDQIEWNAFSFATISWIFPLLRKGYSKPLEEDDLPALATKDSAVVSSHWLDDFTEHCVAARSRNETPSQSLVSALFPHVSRIVFTNAFLQAILITTNISTSLVIGEVVNYLNPEYPRDKLILQNGYALAFLFFGIQIVTTFCTNMAASNTMITSLRLQAAMITAVYRKALRLGSQSRREYPAGRINTFIATDIPKIGLFMQVINTSWSIPIQVAVSLYFVSTLLKIATVIAAGVFVGCAGLLFLIMPPLRKAFLNYDLALDHRTTQLREFLYGIKAVKYHALEDEMEKRIQADREDQITALYGMAKYLVLLFIVILLQQSFTTPMAILTYDLLGGNMDPAVVFTAYSLLQTLMAISPQLFGIVSGITTTSVAYKRIQTFLQAEEVSPDEITSHQPISSSSKAILLENACFTWESAKDKVEAAPSPPTSKGDEEITLKDTDSDIFTLTSINLQIPHGSLVAVVGATGSGKSSLLAALASQMRKTSGTAVLYSTQLAYCPQEPWILSGTIQDNITLLSPSVTPSHIDTAIAACALAKDLASFPAGVNTQIGEKGINLSGGQKARIALARAIASDADLVLLDDPLSALDAHVGKEVFEQAVQGAMKGKTVLIATHLLHVLPKCDYVVVMEAGEIVQFGEFVELMGDEKGRLVQIMKDYHLDEEEGLENVVVAKKKGKVEDETREQEVVAEDRQTGLVTTETYAWYFRLFGFNRLGLLMCLFVMMVGFKVSSGITLSSWTSNAWALSGIAYLVTYCSLTFATSVIGVCGNALTLYSTIPTSRRIHNNAMGGLLRAKMSFYDTQPIGRIINRLSKDIEQMDNGMDRAIMNIFSSSSEVLVSLLVICISSYYIIPIVIAFCITAVLIFSFFKKSYRELKRLSSIMQSPNIAHISETLSGIPTVLAYNGQPQFIAKQMARQDQANLSMLLFSHSQYWINLRLDALGALITLSLVLFGVGGILPRSFVGLALSLVGASAVALNGLLAMIADLEANMVAVERLNYYAFQIPAEASRDLPKDSTLTNWPSSGSIDIKNLELCYDARPDHKVINGITLHISAGEKIGVVGRTGSGKSTLMDSFFRLIEAQAGSITIDGQDISTLGLRKLRTSIQMIPQNPTLFDGSFRSNIDPSRKYTDEDIWYALECVGMKEYVSSLNEKLDSAISEGGTNLSAGQRQLLCLAKVLLEKSKILIMDEATSSVDAESDKRIQDSMKTYFKDATVLSVAHRLNTIAAFDKVLVLENGKVAEFEPPHLLLSREGTIFGEMVNATGSANAAVIGEIARDHYDLIRH